MCVHSHNYETVGSKPQIHRLWFLSQNSQYFYMPGTPLTRSVTIKSHWPEASLECHNFCWENDSGIKFIKNESTESQTQTSGNLSPTAGILYASHEAFFYLLHTLGSPDDTPVPLVGDLFHTHHCHLCPLHTCGHGGHSHGESGGFLQ